MLDKIEIEYERQIEDKDWQTFRFISLDRHSGQIIYRDKSDAKNSKETIFKLDKGLDKFFENFDKEDLFVKRLDPTKIPYKEDIDDQRFTISLYYGPSRKVIENDYKAQGLPEEYFVFLISFKELLASFDGLEILNEYFYKLNDHSPKLKNLLELNYSDNLIYVATDDLSIQPGDRVLIDVESDIHVTEGVHISSKVIRQILVEEDKLEKDTNLTYISRDMTNAIAPDDDRSYYVRRAPGGKND